MSWLCTLCSPLASPSGKKGGGLLGEGWGAGPTLGCTWPGRDDGDPGLCSRSWQSSERAGGLNELTSLQCEGTTDGPHMGDKQEVRSLPRGALLCGRRTRKVHLGKERI